MRRCDRGIRTNDRRRALHGNCTQTCGRPWRSSASRTPRPGRSARPAIVAAQIFASNLHGARHTLRRGEDARSHAIGRHRRAIHACNEGRRDAGVDRKPPANGHRAIDDMSPAQNDGTSKRWHVVSSQARRADETCRHEHPVSGFDLICLDQFVGRERCPARVFIAIAPVDPGRRPFIARHPEPAQTAVESPSAIMIDDPAPIRLGVVGYPVPSPLVRIDPMPVLVGTPIRRHGAGHPHFAKPRVGTPRAILFKRDLCIFGDLRRCRRRDGQKRNGQGANGNNGMRRNSESQTSQSVTDAHYYPPRRQIPSTATSDKCGVPD